MKRDPNLGWELIEHDPLLRQELTAIEQHQAGEDELISSLLEFYGRIERMMSFTLMLADEKCCP
jgi:hypothetical protein